MKVRVSCGASRSAAEGGPRVDATSCPAHVSDSFLTAQGPGEFMGVDFVLPVLPFALSLVCREPSDDKFMRSECSLKKIEQ